jgi:flotillin
MTPANLPMPLMMAAVSALLVFGLVVLIVKRYRRCPSNRLLVIYGKTGSGAAKCVHGGAAFVWPVIQDSAFLPLDPFVVPIDLNNALSQENIRVSVPTTVTVAVSTQKGIMENAAVRLLGLPFHELRGKAEDIILGQMRAVIATMRIEEINSDRQAFLGKVNEAVATELEKIGLEVINTNIKDIDDESGYIKALGKKAAAEAIQQAEIDVAEAKRRGEIGVAEREKDRRIAVSRATAEAQVGEAQAERDRRVAVANAVAEADAGEAEAARTRRQKLALLEAEAVKTESGAAADQAGFKSAQQVAEEEARSKAESAARRADGAIRVAMEQAAKEAEDARALREESRLRAEVVVQAEADKKRIELAAQAEQQKQIFVARGKAEAELTQAQADAKGTQAILDAKAAGYRELVESVGGAGSLAGLLIVEKLAELSRIQADAIKNLPIDKITVWDGGGSGKGGLSRLGKELIGVLPPLHDLARQAGLDLPEMLGRLHDSLDGEELRPKGSLPPPIPRSTDLPLPPEPNVS